MKPTYEQLERQLAAIVAENANKSRCIGFFASVIKSGETWTSICQHEYSEALKTPATDAFLAEVRAQGVEMFAASLGSPYVERGEECYQDGYTHAIERIKCRKAPEFADQLRKGVQS